MGLSLLSPLPSRDEELSELRSKVIRLEAALLQAQQELRYQREKSVKIEAGVGELRKVLTPLYQGLSHVFGQMEGIGLEEQSKPKTSAVWESWKKKLGGQSAEAIDILALHGEMNADQLRIHLSCARTHVYNIISKLNKAGVIIKNGGRVRLKEL